VKAKKQPKKPQADGEAGPSRPKTKPKPKKAEPGAEAKKVKPVKDTTCVKTCQKGQLISE
jgi:hypothetical protein